MQSQITHIPQIVKNIYRHIYYSVVAQEQSLEKRDAQAGLEPMTYCLLGTYVHVDALPLSYRGISADWAVQRALRKPNS